MDEFLTKFDRLPFEETIAPKYMEQANIYLSNSDSSSHNIDFQAQKTEQTTTKSWENYFSQFPQTRYYGSKRRILPWIKSKLETIAFHSVLDVFGGSGSVSLLLNSMGKHVTFNDHLISNTKCASALMAHKISPRGHSALLEIINATTPNKGFIAKNFRDIYFTDQENEWLDGIMLSLQSIKQPDMQDVLFYGLFQACLQKRPFNLFHRANLALRTNKNIDRSFGNLTTWNTPFPTLIEKNIASAIRTQSFVDGAVTILDPSDALAVKGAYDLVYIDPPYIGTSRSPETYLDKYHFLEGLCLYEQWESRIDWNSKNLRFNDKPDNRLWYKKSRFMAQLNNLIDNHDASIIALSYVSDGYPSIEELCSLFEKKFRKFDMHSVGLKYVLAKKQKTEYLLVGHPK